MVTAVVGNRSPSCCDREKAGSNTAADHVVVLDAALAQLPSDLWARDETGQVAVLAGWRGSTSSVWSVCAVPGCAV